MTNKKITDFTTGPALTGNEFFPIAIGDKNYKYDLNFISTWFSGKPTAYNFGALADDPTVSPFDGGPIPLGAQYYNTTLNAIRAFGDGGWFTPNLDAAIFALATGAQLVGTPEGTVQDALDGRLTKAEAAAADGATKVGVTAAPGEKLVTVEDQLRSISVRLSDFNAVEGGVYPSDSPFKRAATVAHQRGVPLNIDVSITVGDSVTLTGGSLTLIGKGKITQSGTRLVIMNDADLLSVGEGLRFECSVIGAALPSIAFLGHSVRNVDFRASVGNVLTVFDATGVNGRNESCRVQSSFDGDFTGATGGDTANILDVRGYELFDWSGSQFNCLGAERFVKSAGQNTLMSGNNIQISGTCTKQVIDCYDGTKRTEMSNFRVIVSGAATFYENKQASMSPALQEAVSLTHGFSRITTEQANATVVAVQGAWGLPHETAGYSCMMDLTGSRFEMISSQTTVAPIQFRGVTSLVLNGTYASSSNGTAALQGGNSKSISFQGSTLVGGAILQDGLSTSDGVLYTKATETILGSDFSIPDYAGGVPLRIQSITALKSLLLERASFDRATAPPGGGTMIYLNNCPNIGSVKISGMLPAAVITSTKFATAGTTTILSGFVRGNSWQRGRVTWDPGSIAAAASVTFTGASTAGAVLGDLVKFNEPYNLLGLTKTDYLSPSAFPRVTLSNPTAGALAPGSGSWAWETWKDFG